LKENGRILCGSREEGVSRAQLAFHQPLPMPVEKEGLPWDAPEFSRTGVQSISLSFKKEVTVKLPHQQYI